MGIAGKFLTNSGVSFILFKSNALTENQQNWTRSERTLSAYALL